MSNKLPAVIKTIHSGVNYHFDQVKGNGISWCSAVTFFRCVDNFTDTSNFLKILCTMSWYYILFIFDWGIQNIGVHLSETYCTVHYKLNHNHQQHDFSFLGYEKLTIPLISSSICKTVGDVWQALSYGWKPFLSLNQQTLKYHI